MSGEKPKVRYLRLRNRLKAKVGGSGMGGPGEFSADILERVAEEVRKMAEDYPDWVKEHLGAVQQEYEQARDNPEQRAKRMKAINLAAHELKGQGGIFGYPLMTTFGDSLYAFTAADGGLSDSHMEIIKAHIDAMRVVINERVEGDGGAVGEELTRALDQAIEKYSKV